MVTATYRDSTGVLWAGGYGRLWKLEEREWQEIPAPPELARRFLRGEFVHNPLHETLAAHYGCPPHKPACSGWRPASGSKFSYQVSHHPNIPR